MSGCFRLPDKIFDAHAHLWNFEYWSDQVQTKQGWVDGASNPADPLASGDMAMFKKEMDKFCPGREMGGLVLSTPNLAADNLGHSAWSAEECRKTMAANPGYGFYVCAMTTTMDTTYDDIVQGVKDFGYVGLKCYHFYSKNVEHTFDADIMQYVTHEQCRAANELGLSLSIHMVKKRALSDQSNLETVRMLCETYPNMTVILCHSARGFNMHHVRDNHGMC
jgi:glutamate-1-semialdehyde 2,1-aminomutase